MSRRAGTICCGKLLAVAGSGACRAALTSLGVFCHGTEFWLSLPAGADALLLGIARIRSDFGLGSFLAGNGRPHFQRDIDPPKRCPNMTCCVKKTPDRVACTRCAIG